MITKGITQEQKVTILFNYNIEDLSLPTSATEVTLFKRKLDFTDIDYLLVSSRMKLSGANGTGHLKTYIDTTNKTDHSNTLDTYTNDTNLVDCTSITGSHDLKLTYSNSGAGLVMIKGMYIGVVDN